jgi:hypothetical protein
LSQLASTFVSQLRVGVLTEILNEDFRCMLQLPTLSKNLTVCEVIGTDDQQENDASALSITIIGEPKLVEALAQIIA